ncbi:NUDIX domain-containing protein [Cellulosilyticum ruminicola]|uniref:NUDIX domain-containing protein n=1 Tax=Cellulosilyticum ruminicola TaxID=425254 RepID=UPI0006D16042|nr:NUDIX domain-containing protein [Cellulosilyticum ruminicola]
MELMPDDPNRFNQSLMELGALVCTPKNPKCDICPVRTICEAHRYGEEEKYPIKEKKIKAVKEQYQVVLLKKGQRYGLEKRPAEGLLANLWGTPMIEHKVWKKCGLNTYEQRELSEVIHIFTHKKWQMTPVVINWSQKAEILLKEAKTNSEPIQYYALEEMENIPVATAFKKILQKL